jgi:hypothetical protein
MLGFTREEPEEFFEPRIEELARSLRMTRARFLEEMSSYCNGFSFDGETRVCNHYSILLYFFSSEIIFANNWFDSATPDSLVDYMGDKHLKVEQFPGQTISHSFARAPGALDETGPMDFPHQAGYSTLRPAPDEDGPVDPSGGPLAEGGSSSPLDASDGGRRPQAIDKDPQRAIDEKRYILDHPGQEVREAMSSLATRDILGGKEAQDAGKRLKTAFGKGNVDGVVEEFNAMSSRVDHSDHHKPPDPEGPGKAEKTLVKDDTVPCRPP